MSSANRLACHLLATLLLLAGVSRAGEPLVAGVVAVDGDAVTLDKGQRDGVQEGHVFDIYRDAELFQLPLSMGTQPLVKSQARIGQVVVHQVEAERCEAHVIQGQPGEAGARALHNPTAVIPNRAPRFTKKPVTHPVAWREAQRLALKVSNDPDDLVVYTWSSTGGQLAHERTLAPVNTWYAPPEAGNYTVSVVALDLGSGKQAVESIPVSSRGVPTQVSLGEVRVQRKVSPASHYQQVVDMAFDSLGRRYVLERGQGGFLSRGRLSLRVEFPDRAPLQLPAGDRELSALVVSNPRRGGNGWTPGAIFAIDADAHTVLRFGFGPAWGRVLQQQPLVIGRKEGGPGNGSFVNPVDLAISSDGEVLYVLDAGQRCVQAFQAEDGAFLFSFGQPGGDRLQLQSPRALAVNARGDVYVLDDGRKSVVVYRGWRPIEEWSAGGAEEDLGGLACDPFSSDVFVLERSKGWIKRFRSGALAAPHYTPPVGHLGQLRQAQRLRFDPLRVLWTADREGTSVVRLDSASLELLGRTGGVELSTSLRIAGTPQGGVAALDLKNQRVVCFDREGWITARFGDERDSSPLREPIDVAVAASGEVFVLDAGQGKVFGFSPAGASLYSYGSPGPGPRELMGVVDLSASSDRSLLAVVQQRSEDNFNLISPADGRSVAPFGRDYTGEATPRFGCVTRGEGTPVYWTVDDNREGLRRAPENGHPTPLSPAPGCDDVSDVEPGPHRWVYVCDAGDARVRVLAPDGTLVRDLEGKDLVGAGPWDLGVDDYGHLFVFDYKSGQILVLGD